MMRLLKASTAAFGPALGMSLGNFSRSGSRPTHSSPPLAFCASLSLAAKFWGVPSGTTHDIKASRHLGSMLIRYHETVIAQQTPYWTAFGAAAREPPRRAPYQQHCVKALLRDCRCMGALAAAAVPTPQD